MSEATLPQRRYQQLREEERFSLAGKNKRKKKKLRLQKIVRDSQEKPLSLGLQQSIVNSRSRFQSQRVKNNRQRKKKDSKKRYVKKALPHSTNSRCRSFCLTDLLPMVSCRRSTSATYAWESTDGTSLLAVADLFEPATAS
jgi:hypothetical protein